MRLTLLHTNDLHGHVDELARLATQARILRNRIEAGGEHCLLIDCGDAEERTVLEMAVTQGSAAMAYLRAAGYDLGAMGNGAPLSFGPQVIAGMAEAAGFPLLAANLLDQDGNLVPGCTRSILYTIGSAHVGFIGLAPRWSFWTLFGLQNPDPVPIVQTELDKLRQQGATIFVLLSHLGLVEDLQLVGQVPDLDVILGGHSHTTIFAGLLQGQSDTLIAQAGDFGRYLGRVDLEIDETTGVVTHKRATLIPLDPAIDPDPDLLAEVKHQQDKAGSMLAEPVGELTAALSYDPIRESAAANLLADVIRERTGVDVALCQPTHLLASLPAGVVTLHDLYRVSKSPGNPAWRSLRGAQLIEMVETGLDADRARQTAPWGRGRLNGQIAVSGLTARYNPAAPPGQRLSHVLIGEKPLEPQRIYMVGGSDAEMTNLGWQDAYGNLQLSFSLADDDVSYEVPITLRGALEEYIRRHSPVKPPAAGRIIPEGL